MDLGILDADIVEGVSVLMREALAHDSPNSGRGGNSSRTCTMPAFAWVSFPAPSITRSWNGRWKMFGIAAAFTTVVTSASAGFYKSRPEIYLHAAEQLGVVPQPMVHVGDSLRFDVGGASRAGMGTVWLQHRERHDGRT